MQTAVRTLAFIFAITCLASPTSAGVDAKAVADAITAHLAVFGFKVKIASAESSGDDVVLKGIDAIAEDATPDAQPKTIAELKLENVTEKDGDFVIGQVALSPWTYPVKDGGWDFGGAAMKNITVPKSTGDAVMMFETFQMQPTSFKTDAGKDAFKFGAVVMSITTADDQVAAEMKPMTFAIDTTAIPAKNPSAPNQLAAFGLTELAGTIASHGTWNKKDGRSVNAMSIDLTNAGKLSFKSDVSGYTAALIKSLQAMAEKQEQTKPNKDAAAVEAIGLFQNVTLNGLSLRFDDQSITGRLLDQSAKDQGIEREALVNMLKGMAPMMAVASQDADFITNVSNATSKFLDDPKSFEIRIAPPQPVSMMLLAAIGAGDPKALIKQLNLQVLANQ